MDDLIRVEDIASLFSSVEMLESAISLSNVTLAELPDGSYGLAKEDAVKLHPFVDVKKALVEVLNLNGYLKESLGGAANSRVLVERLEKDAADFDERVEELECEVANLENERDDAIGEASYNYHLSCKWEAQCEDLKAEKYSLEETVSLLRDEASEAEGEMEELQSRVTDLEEEIEKLEVL